MDNLKPIQFLKNHKVLTGFGGLALLIVVLLLIISLVQPNNDSGIAKFNGIQKQVAEIALQATNSDGTDHIRDLPFVYKGSYVKEVYAGPPRGGQCNEGSAYSEDPTNTKHYGAIIGWKTFLNIEYKTLSIHACQIYGG